MNFDNYSETPGTTLFNDIQSELLSKNNNLKQPLIMTNPKPPTQLNRRNDRDQLQQPNLQLIDQLFNFGDVKLDMDLDDIAYQPGINYRQSEKPLNEVNELTFNPKQLQNYKENVTSQFRGNMNQSFRKESEIKYDDLKYSFLRDPEQIPLQEKLLESNDYDEFKDNLLNYFKSFNYDVRGKEQIYVDKLYEFIGCFSLYGEIEDYYFSDEFHKCFLIIRNNDAYTFIDRKSNDVIDLQDPQPTVQGFIYFCNKYLRNLVTEYDCAKMIVKIQDDIKEKFMNQQMDYKNKELLKQIEMYLESSDFKQKEYFIGQCELLFCRYKKKYSGSHESELEKEKNYRQQYYQEQPFTGSQRLDSSSRINQQPQNKKIDTKMNSSIYLPNKSASQRQNLNTSQTQPPNTSKKYY
ncbi:hypothetical protein ABPG72_008159 [Tetrahymena utriculariae]